LELKYNVSRSGEISGSPSATELLSRISFVSSDQGSSTEFRVADHKSALVLPRFEKKNASSPSNRTDIPRSESTPLRLETGIAGPHVPSGNRLLT
jgi:hypothetical protein